MRNTTFMLSGPRTIQSHVSMLQDLETGWVRLRFLYCGLCGSDLSMFEGRDSVVYPRSIGHEFIAIVDEAGPSVRDIVPGDLVTSDLNYRCGDCDQCDAKRSHLCREGQAGHFSNRAFAELGDIHASYLFRLPAGASPHLCLIEPLSCVLHAVDWARATPDERVLVIGAGSIGMCMAFALSNESPPIHFDFTDSMPTRLAALAVAVAPIGRCVGEPSGEYDVVFDVSGSESGLKLACDRVKAGGRLCSMSHIDGAVSAEFLLKALTRRDVTFTISYLNGERSSLTIAAKLLQEHWTSAWQSLVEVVPLRMIQEGFERRRSSPMCKTIFKVADANGIFLGDAVASACQLDPLALDA